MRRFRFVVTLYLLYYSKFNITYGGKQKAIKFRINLRNKKVASYMKFSSFSF